jgi:hypothetical protein
VNKIINEQRTEKQKNKFVLKKIGPKNFLGLEAFQKFWADPKIGPGHGSKFMGGSDRASILPIFFSNTSARGWRRRVEFNNTA